VRLMQAFSSNKTDYIPLVNSLGLFFQIQDDYMNLQSEEYAENKSFCEDLTEGKFSFPIIHAIRQNPSDHRLLNILKQRSSKDSIKMYAVSYMEQLGSFKYTRDVIAQLQRDTSALIEQHGGNAAIAEIVQYLAAKVFAEEQPPRRPTTPSRADGKPKSPLPRVPESSGQISLTLSADYQELDHGE
jgi:geranylgeranyl diphosphate synthase type 3